MIAATKDVDHPDDAIEFVADAFAEFGASRAQKKWLRVTVPAPAADPLNLPELSLLWSNATEKISGSGMAYSVRAQGCERFSTLRQRSDEFWSQTVHRCHRHVPRAPVPRLFGGIAFASDRNSEEWSEFRDGLFFAPRLLYVANATGHTLTVCARADECDDALFQLRQALAALQRNASPCFPRATSWNATVHSRPQASWRQLVESLRSAIDAGKVQKVVAARRTTVHMGQPAHLPTVLKSLLDQNQLGTCFAFVPGKSAFVGASPEPLVSRRGDQVATVALAGSTASSSPEGVAKLLASNKDRTEQHIVVESIAATLRNFCDSVSFAREPQVQVLPDIFHLKTPIVGRLSRRQHVLELVEALHPTPAVGGAPRERALEFIAREPDERGWYAAPVGWFDNEGDGEFVVAIRSGLLSGPTAFVYSGAGIVADSQPDAEFIETTLKQQSMLKALGASD